MDSNAFVSHTQKGGTGTGKTIKDHLSSSDLEMESFLSSESIHAGEHISEKILKSLINTDLCFVILESLVITSKWVKWEYNFCKSRKIKIIPVISYIFAPKKNRVEWFDQNLKHLVYKDEDTLRAKIWDEVDNIKNNLERRSTWRNKISLKITANKITYHEEEKITIAGSVSGVPLGIVYVHIPILDQDPPIQSINMSQSIKPNPDGTFKFDFNLPPPPVGCPDNRKWFIEIKFDERSKLIPITVNLRGNGNSSNNNPNKIIKPSSVPAKQDKDIEDFKKEIKLVSEGTSQSIPNTINEETLDRGEKVSEISKLLNDNDRIVITGDKGSGKSALLCQLYEKLKQTVLFLRCDDYLRIESFEELNNSIINGHNFIESVQNIALESKKIVIIFDSLDAISRNEKAMNIFKQFLKKLWGTNKVQTICTVRSYDYEYSTSISTVEWGKEYHLGKLKDKEIKYILEQLGNPIISDEIKKILDIPLHLKLLSLILKKCPDTDFTNITNEIDLYDKHWYVYVEKSDSPDKMKDSLFNVVEEMIKLQKISIPYSADIVHEILSENLVLRDELTGLVSFFHHAYLDYVVSRFILEKYDTIVDFIQQDQYNIFLRPTIVFALSILHRRDAKKSIKVIVNILNSEIQYYWKISAITALAKIQKSDDQDFTELGNILSKEIMLQRHFLMEITKQNNSFWFDLWHDSIFVEWSPGKDANSFFIVSYLSSIIETSNHQDIFKIVKLLVEKSNQGWAKREAIKDVISKINVPQKTEWLLELSKNEDSHIRNGVIETLSELITTNPEAVPDILCNLFTYVETSNDKTKLSEYGTMEFTSTKSQDNNLIKWRAGKLFPELLEKNPKQMIVATIKIFHILRKIKMNKQSDTVIEDNGYLWFEGGRHSHDETQFLVYIRKYLVDCTDEKFEDLIPVFDLTNLATFHSILIEALINRESKHEEIFKRISDPKVYEIDTLTHSVRKAIKAIASSLGREKLAVILKNIMNISLSNKKLNDDNPSRLDKTKAGFLSEFPSEILHQKHLDILDKFPKKSLEYEPPFKSYVEFEEPSQNTIPKPTAEETIENMLDTNLEDNEKIKLLEAISKYLAKKTNEIDDTKIPSIKKFLIANKNDLDPKHDNTDDATSYFVTDDPTIRGLVANCLNKLLHHTKDVSLVDIIKQLANDPDDIVRGEISKTLNCIFYYDYDWAFSIAEKYSQSTNRQIQFYLPYVLNLFVHKNPKHATILVHNILKAISAKHETGVENFLIFLALEKEERGAIVLLDNIIDKQYLSSKIRCNIPFILKEHYLFENKYQEQSLDILDRLLDDPDHTVKEQSVFFILNSFEKDDTQFIKKISRHLDKIVAKVDKTPWNLKIIEELVGFLSDYWQELPQKSIEYLEKLTGDKLKEHTSTQAQIADKTIVILNGLFRHYTLDKEDKKRCLDILDNYVIAGWSEALELLSKMERTD